MLPREEKPLRTMMSTERSLWKWLKKKKRSLSHRWWRSSINSVSLSKNSSKMPCIMDRIKWNKSEWCRFNKSKNLQALMIMRLSQKKNVSKHSRFKLTFRCHRWKRWLMTQIWRTKWLTYKTCHKKIRWIWWWRLSSSNIALKINYSHRQVLRKNNSINQLSNSSLKKTQILERLLLSHNLVPWLWHSKPKEEWVVALEVQADPWVCSDIN